MRCAGRPQNFTTKDSHSSVVPATRKDCQGGAQIGGMDGDERSRLLRNRRHGFLCAHTLCMTHARLVKAVRGQEIFTVKVGQLIQ